MYQVYNIWLFFCTFSVSVDLSPCGRTTLGAAPSPAPLLLPSVRVPVPRWAVSRSVGPPTTRPSALMNCTQTKHFTSAPHRLPQLHQHGTMTTRFLSLLYCFFFFPVYKVTLCSNRPFIKQKSKERGGPGRTRFPLSPD